MNQIIKNSSLFALFAAGCGGGYTPPPANPGTPQIQAAVVSGQYDLLLHSTNGHGTTTVYTNFTQTGKTFSGGAKTLVCPSNDLSQCQGDDAQAVSISASGSVNGENISITISFLSAQGTNTVTMAGTVTVANLAGTYTDSQGDSGTWTALAASSFTGGYTGTYNSTSHPLLIAPTTTIVLAQDTFTLTGTATITSSPCISSLTLSGQAIGGAFSLTDAANKVHFLAVPTDPNSGSFAFNYNFEPTAPHCAGDVGHGTLTSTADPWGY